MNFNRFTLCFMIFTTSAFGAAPATQSLEDKIAALNTMSDSEILCQVVSNSPEIAQRALDDKKKLFVSHAEKIPSFNKVNAQSRRLSQIWWAIQHEVNVCPDELRKQELQDKMTVVELEFQKTAEQRILLGNSLIYQKPEEMYNYQTCRLDNFIHHSSLLLAKNQKLEQEKMQLQHDKQALLAENKNLKYFINNGPPNRRPTTCARGAKNRKKTTRFILAFII